MDALSDVLRAIRLSGGLFFRVELRAPFAVGAMEQGEMRQLFAAGADHVLPFHMVTSGSMWFEAPGLEAAELNEGDIIVLPRGSSHALLDRPGRTPVAVSDLIARTGDRTSLRFGGDGPPAHALCGFFRCNGRLFNPLLEALPPFMVIRADPGRTPWLAATMQRAFAEGLEGRAGGEALVQRLTELLFVEVVQAWAREHPATGWLAGLADPLVARALAELHGDPARDWSMDELARRCGTSRTALADRFRERVGLPPMHYLTQWRMELAADRLLTTDRSVAEIAGDVGYQSEAALNRAFKRHVGEPPASWRRARLTAAAPPPRSAGPAPAAPPRARGASAWGTRSPRRGAR